MMKCTKENSKELRLAAMESAKAAANDTLAEKITNHMVVAWGEWQPDYAGWLNWSNGLYAADATINAIGGEQLFRDYQKSMKGQRDACTMAMGPIEQSIVQDNVIALVYHMYLTPKTENAPTFDMIVTEFNTLEEVNGKLMVTHLVLYTDGGGLNHR